jgi:hypothetical protein
LKGILRGLTENRAETHPASSDRRLLGRTYAIPFESVWSAGTRLVTGELRGWSLVHADDQLGTIEGVAKPLLWGPPCEVHIEIGLDENGQTRVDASSATGGTRGDLGRSRRTIGRFFRALDRELAAQPEQILDPTLAPAWLGE